jgi:hypothetical protein
VSSASPKLAATLLVGLLAVGSLGVLAASSGVSDLRQLVFNAPTAIPTPYLCPGSANCHLLIPKKFTTLEEATRVASFVPLLPSNIPEGYEAYSVLQWRVDDSGGQAADKLAVHNDWIAVLYRDKAGHNLMVSQGFPAMPDLGAYLAGEESGQFFGEHGTLTLSNGGLAYWIEDMPFGFAGPGPMYGLMLSWEVGRYGTGWELSPDRATVSYGSPMSYTIVGDDLSLDQITAMANSVPLN